MRILQMNWRFFYFCCPITNSGMKGGAHENNNNCVLKPWGMIVMRRRLEPRFSSFTNGRCVSLVRQANPLFIHPSLHHTMHATPFHEIRANCFVIVPSVHIYLFNVFCFSAPLRSPRPSTSNPFFLRTPSM